MSVNVARPSSEPVGVTIRSYSDGDDVGWDEYVRGAVGATSCHLMSWARAVEQTWGHRPLHLCAERDGALVGVLPLFHVRSRLFSSMLVSTPGAIYGGALADNVDLRHLLVLQAKRRASELGVDYLELRDTRDVDDAGVDPELRRKDLYVRFERPICDDEAALMESFPKKIRYAIRQGVKNRLAAESGQAELLDDFYDVYATNMRNLGTPVYPKRLFAELLRQFPDACDILVVRNGRRVAGAALTLYFRDTVLPHYGCADARLHHTGVSSFMYWELMRRAAARGYRRFDFGRSKVGSGSWAFKRGWRMVERPLPYRYFLVRSVDVPNLSPANPKFRLMIEAWKRLPVGVTRLIGPLVVQHIP
jgi:FemAB-related protein (PEP-CTERM system-associated)